MIANTVRISERAAHFRGVASSVPPGEPGQVVGGSRSVDRALQVLLLVSKSPRPLRFAELQRSTRIAKGTLHGIVRSLQAARFLQASGGGLSVGMAAFEVGTSLPVLRSARANADAALDELRARTEESVHFGTLVDGDVLYLSRRDATYDLRSASRIGDRKRAYGTALGKAMLALLEEAVVEALYPADLPPLTANTISTREQLIAELHRFRERGFATECEESTVGVRCIGMAFAVANQLYGLSLTVPVQRMSEGDLEELQPLLAVAVSELSAAMQTSSLLGALEAP